MKKRIIFYSTTLAIVAALTVGVYKIYQPRQAVVTPTSPQIVSVVTPDYTTSNITDYLSAQAAPVVALFLTPGTSDTVYIQDNILLPILAAYGDEALNNLIIVDMSSFTTAASINEAKTRFGFYSWPSFANLQIVNGITTINSVLEWNSTTPTTYDQAVTWLTTNNILAAN